MKDILIVNLRKEIPGFIPLEEAFLADKLSRSGCRRIEIRSVLPEEIEANAEDISRMASGDTCVVLWESASYKSCQTLLDYFAFARAIRSRSDVALVASGYWVDTLYPHYPESFEPFDLLISGCNIDAVAELLAGHDRASLPSGLVEARGLCDWNAYNLDLSFISSLDRYVGNGFVAGYRTTFGCPRNCLFCYNNMLRKLGARYSERSLEKVSADIETIVGHYGDVPIQLKDRNFFCNKKRAIDILDMLHSNGVRIASNIDITVHDSHESIFQKCREVGVESMFFGLESFYPSSRKQFNKNYEQDKLERLFEMGDEYEIVLSGCLLFGLPWQTMDLIADEVHQACRYMDKHPYLRINFNNYHPLPMTELQEKFFPDFSQRLTLEELYEIYNFRMDAVFQEKLYGDKFSSINLGKLRAYGVALNAIALLKKHHVPALFHPLLNFARFGIRRNILNSAKPGMLNDHMSVQNVNAVRRKITRFCIQSKKFLGMGA